MEESSDNSSKGEDLQTMPMEATRTVEVGDWGRLHHGDCLTVLQTMPENSVDAIVTDPPAGIAFMDSEWDNPAEYGTSGHGYADGAGCVSTPVVSSSRNPMCRKRRRHRRGWKDVPGCE
jgi:hypothetical protein